MVQYKTKDAGVLDGMVKFVIYTKLQISSRTSKLKTKMGWSC